VEPVAAARWRRNGLLAAGRYGLAAVLALAVTSYALRVLGPTQFGVWALAGGLLPVLRLLDLGLGRALTREVALADGGGQPTRAAPAFAATRLALVGIGLAILAATWALREPLTRLLAVPAELAGLTAYVLIGTAAVVALEDLFVPHQAALDGLGRMDLTSLVDAVQRLASTLGVALVLALGWGLPGLVWKNLVTALVAGLAYRQLLRRQAPELARAGWRAPGGTLRRLLAFGGHVQTVNLAALLVEPVAKTLLSRSAGLEAVTVLDLALKVVGQLAGAFLALGASLFSAAAATVGRADAAAEERLPALYRAAARAVGLLALPPFGLLAVLAGPFVAAWLGPTYAPVAGALALLAVGWLVAVLGQPAFLLAQGGGQAASATVAGLVTGGVSLLLCLLWVRPYGAIGAAAALALGLAAGGVVALALARRRLGLRWGQLVAIPPRAWLATAVGLVLAGWLGLALPVSLVAVVFSGLAGLLVDGLLLVALGVVRPGAWPLARRARS
jgi:O-antigen/teichoic acid export membrane protein